jgi:hypothetical protein
MKIHTGNFWSNVPLGAVKVGIALGTPNGVYVLYKMMELAPS